MTQRTTGIILRVYPLTETSLIVHWITADFGRIATVAKGGRRPKSPFRGKLDLFYLAELTFRRSRQSELHTLHEVRVLDSHEALRRNLKSLEQAAYCAALIQQNTETETPIPEMFRSLAELLRHLTTGLPTLQTILTFELKFLNELGLAPSFPREGLSAEAQQAMGILISSDWDMAITLKFGPTQLKEISRFLHGFLIYHLGKIPSGRNFEL